MGVTGFSSSLDGKYSQVNISDVSRYAIGAR
ncbi:hypothetical protein PSPPH_4483 [Pseudomonas savastanoi pv. phaseolicola 1448A]|uniref:Uncharacterized protein n=1 Tax=Pseudomonas savastanoi pv. phaseolicola (strain 1448A / Race 6) TaxID=264730 RepID=Q48DE2_PSE14|nr:hypothetical protein PSPPH_4483 [Pseudomonas savastanoi pv. phaseolicola 1448A]